MPIYEYRCEECGERFERLRRIGQGTDGLVCPRCASGAVTREPSTFASGPSRSGSVASSGSPGCGAGGFT